jgi:heme exporter protein A
MPSEIAIKTRGLTRRFNNRVAVRDVDLEVRAGEFVTLLGPNGAGKTTLLRMLCGLLRPTAGEIEILGASLQKNPASAKQKIAFLGHASFLYGGLTAQENLTFYSRLYGIRDGAERIRKMLARVGLRSRADDLVHGFSRGMKQRLTIARALLHDPEVVFFDEPFTGLDREASATLGEIMDTLRSGGRTVMLVTHQIEEGLRHASRVILISRGSIAEDRPASGLSPETLGELYGAKVQAWGS